jgi:hypothetical protein
MSFSNHEVVARFAKGKTCGRGSHLFIENNTLYSYGHHFPLLVHMPWGNILNADKYSSTTSQHQALASHLATIQIPFSALRAAGITLSDMSLVNHAPARYDLVAYGRWNEVAQKHERITVAEYKVLSLQAQSTWAEVTERRPESAVIEYQGKFYLSSMDSNRYFLSQLPKPVKTTDQAFDLLMPPEVKGKPYLRQGEWFFLKTPDFPIQPATPKFIYHALLPNYALPLANPAGNQHIATRGDCINGQLYVSGAIHHPEHRMLRLSKADDPKIFLAYRNTALASWSAGGKVD